MNNNLANIIKENRIKMGYSQQELSNLVGVSKAYVNKIEHGVSKKPSILYLYKFSYFLDLNFLELVNLTLSYNELEELRNIKGVL